MSLPRPDTGRLGVAEYAVDKPQGPIDLWLDGNEGPAPAAELCDSLAGLDPELLRRYPNPRPLEAKLAARRGLPPEQVCVTAGADEAIDRFCRAFLGPGKNAVVLTPAFEMQVRYVELAGAQVRSVAWTEGPFPLEAVVDAVDGDTVCVAIASPNNPTGRVTPVETILALAERLPSVWMFLDLVYADFLDEDPTPACLALPNALVVASLSKSGGLAGIRVGYAMGPAEAIAAMRRAGGPYSVASTSLALASLALDTTSDFASYRGQVAEERRAFAADLVAGGCRVSPSAANYLLARSERSLWLWQGLAGLGIAARRFGARAGLEDALRLTCPGSPAAAARVGAAIRATLNPEAILFDIDGVLADVRGSYDAAIEATAASFGVAVTPAEIEAAKVRGDANNDWRLTRSLLAAAGVEVPLEEVTTAFEAIYQGELWQRETLCASAELLAQLARVLPLAVVTGRPRRDAERFLTVHGIEDLFQTLICMEDAPAKPSPEPVRLALSTLGVDAAWFVGDTVDDVRAGRAAGVVSLGIPAPGADPELARTAFLQAGAARTLANLDELLTLLPASVGGKTAT